MDACVNPSELLRLGLSIEYREWRDGISRLCRNSKLSLVGLSRLVSIRSICGVSKVSATWSLVSSFRPRDSSILSRLAVEPELADLDGLASRPGGFGGVTSINEFEEHASDGVAGYDNAISSSSNMKVCCKLTISSSSNTIGCRTLPTVGGSLLPRIGGSTGLCFVKEVLTFGIPSSG
jgi:hypothetical protein